MTYEVSKGRFEIFTQQFPTFKVHRSTSLSLSTILKYEFLACTFSPVTVLLTSFNFNLSTGALYIESAGLKSQQIGWRRKKLLLEKSISKKFALQKYMWKICSAISKFCFSFSPRCLDFLAGLKAFQSTRLQYISGCMSTSPLPSPNLPSLLVSVYWACSTLCWLHTQSLSALSSW